MPILDELKKKANGKADSANNIRLSCLFGKAVRVYGVDENALSVH